MLFLKQTDCEYVFLRLFLPDSILRLYQPHGFLVSDPLIQLELHQRQDLKRDGRVDKWLGAVDALVTPKHIWGHSKRETNCTTILLRSFALRP